MITWLRLWPVFLIPLLIMLPAGLLPHLNLGFLTFDGGVIRQWSVNTLLLPLLTQQDALLIVHYFQRASYVEEFLLYLFICFNVTVLLMPVFYLVGNVIIRVSTWFAVNELKQKNILARRV